MHRLRFPERVDGNLTVYEANGMTTAGPPPFVLSSWRVVGGSKIYEGSLVKGDQEVVASPVGPQTSIIVRQAN